MCKCLPASHNRKCFLRFTQQRVLFTLHTTESAFYASHHSPLHTTVRSQHCSFSGIRACVNASLMPTLPVSQHGPFPGIRVCVNASICVSVCPCVNVRFTQQLASHHGTLPTPHCFLRFSPRHASHTTLLFTLLTTVRFAQQSMLLRFAQQYASHNRVCFLRFAQQSMLHTTESSFYASHSRECFYASHNRVCILRFTQQSAHCMLPISQHSMFPASAHVSAPSNASMSVHYLHCPNTACSACTACFPFSLSLYVFS
ncbi:hypothetical protein NEPAR04_2226 [Nematocida parisii]|nr:hypothetical protein NEPAR04_2226 [Nematocida parisii]KAI5168150.1 hypothetical protein NEIRO02_2428 [Nematocida sp. AWRm79]